MPTVAHPAKTDAIRGLKKCDDVIAKTGARGGQLKSNRPGWKSGVVYIGGVRRRGEAGRVLVILTLGQDETPFRNWGAALSFRRCEILGHKTHTGRIRDGIDLFLRVVLTRANADALGCRKRRRPRRARGPRFGIVEVPVTYRSWMVSRDDAKCSPSESPANLP